MIYAQRDREDPQGGGYSVRIALYPESGGPEITEAAASSARSAADKFSSLVGERVRELGGKVPEESVREVVENLIHADYKGVVISIFDSGCSVRISDKGPGIEHKERAFEFGFTSATREMVEDIRGVGAGLGIAQAAAEKVGGKIAIEDNMGGGTVTTISVPAGSERPEPAAQPEEPQRRYPGAVPKMDISERQEKVLLTVMEYGEVGPSTVAEQLEISVSTAYRDLSVLQEQGLLHGDETGKRLISPLGRDLVGAIIQNWVQ